MKLTGRVVAAMIVSAAAWANGEGAGLPQAAVQEKEPGKEDLPARVGKLEEQMEAQKPSWDPAKMLSFSTPDGNFTARIGGLIGVNYKHIFARDDAGGGSADGFFLDTAKMKLEGTFYKDFYYRVEGEMKTSNSGAMSMEDCYVGWNAFPDPLTFQAGQMKTPWSQEETCSDRFIDFGERSLLNRLAPGRDQGFLANGFFLERILEYNLGLFNGAYSRNAGKNAVNPDDSLDAAGRVFVTPFKSSGQAALENLRVGVDATVGNREDLALGSGITTGDLGGVTVNPFAPAGTLRADGLQTRRLLNFSWIYKAVSLRAEYGVVHTSLNETATAGGFDMKAGCVQATCLLTGESKSLESRVKPLDNLSPAEGTFGAFELAARLAFLDTGDGVKAGVVDPAANTRTRELTLGLNWWWIPNVVFRLNWERFLFDEEIPNLTSRGAGDSQDILYARWQIDF